MVNANGATDAQRSRCPRLAIGGRGVIARRAAGSRLGRSGWNAGIAGFVNRRTVLLDDGLRVRMTGRITQGIAELPDVRSSSTASRQPPAKGVVAPSLRPDARRHRAHAAEKTPMLIGGDEPSL